jgi:hypothetical protein
LGAFSSPFSLLKNAGASVKMVEAKKGGENASHPKGQRPLGSVKMIRKYAYKVVRGELIFNDSNDKQKIDELIREWQQCSIAICKHVCKTWKIH